jgi:dephospho-CoA kinase
MTFILGLTGSIGMGKSTVARFLRDRGIPVHDSDAAVHALYQGQAASKVEALVKKATGKSVMEKGAINRQKLAQALMQHPALLADLEALIHPLVRTHQQAFVETCASLNRPICVLEIPLLFETGAQLRCDAVVVVSASHAIQRKRVMARDGMTKERFEMIHVKQMPDAQKRTHAHFIIDTSGSLEATKRQVDALLRALAGRS